MPVKLKTIYEKIDEIPEGFADLYLERNGKMELTGVEGVKTQADLDRVNEALRKEREDHKGTKIKLNKFGDLNPDDDIIGKLAELDETKATLEAMTKDGKLDDKKITPLVDAAVRRITAPMEREKTQLQRDLDAARKVGDDAAKENAILKTSITQGNIERNIRDAAIGAKIAATAIEDAVMYGANVFEVMEDGRVLTKDVRGTTPGIEAKEWFKDMQEKRPHWWPTSVGGGARGGAGGTGRSSNPWAAENWNITAQGAYARQHGEAKAREAAAAVGSSLGATSAAKKVA